VARATLAAYERWAGTYVGEPHNPLMAAEQTEMLRLMPALRGRRVLDLACGTGRYARIAAKAGAASIVALDFSPAMLARAGTARRVRADMARLPFVGECFDVVVSGLAIGHATSVQDWMSEAARVLAPGGALLWSDFHPDAARRGFSRSFRDGERRTHTVPHVTHDVAAQCAAAEAAGLACEAVHELRAGIEFRETFPGSAGFYRREAGVALVLVARARKAVV